MTSEAFHGETVKQKYSRRAMHFKSFHGGTILVQVEPSK